MGGLFLFRGRIARRRGAAFCQPGMGGAPVGQTGMGAFPRKANIIFKIIFKIYIDYILALVVYYKKRRVIP